MTEGDTKESDGRRDDEEQADEPDQKEEGPPMVTLRGRPRGAMSWPRLTRLRLKDGTPVEDLMMP